MKLLKYILPLILLVLSFSNSKAQNTYGTIVKFVVLPEYLLPNGKIKINGNESTTTIKCKVDFSRTVNTSNGSWNPFNMTVMMVTYNNSTNIVKISDSKNVTSSNFTDATAFLKDFEITFVITNSKLTSGHNVWLGFESPDLPSGAIGGFSKEYGFETVTTPTTSVANPFWTITTIKRLPYGNWPENQNQPYWYPSGTVPMLVRGQTIYSENGQYGLNFQSNDGNLVIFKVSNGQALWSIQKTGGQSLFFEPDGNLIMFNASNQVIWTSNIWTAWPTPSILTHAYFVFQNDGNLVMEFNGGDRTDVIGSTGTGTGVVSSHFGKIKNP